MSMDEIPVVRPFLSTSVYVAQLCQLQYYRHGYFQTKLFDQKVTPY